MNAANAGGRGVTPLSGGEARFTGCGTALITPFQRDQSLDEAALRKLVRNQIEQGIDFLVPCGTTGESPTLTREEHLRVVAVTVEEARRAPGPKGRVSVLAGAGGNNTAGVIALAREVEAVGADGILSVAPYYNRPTQEGLYQHFAAIAAATHLPVVLYNVPGRTASNIEPATVARLAAIPNIVAVKEASGSVAQMGQVLAAAPEDFAVLSGDDGLTLPLLALGGRGLISVASNVLPGASAKMVSLALGGDFAAARRLHFQYLSLIEALFVETNPVPVKAALASLGWCQEVYRLPLVPLQPANRAKLMAALAASGLASRATA